MSQAKHWQKVAPFTGAWIEMIFAYTGPIQGASLPSRERGLKSSHPRQGVQGRQVAPFTGAWIEMSCMYWSKPGSPVAPFTGAWIEISPGRQRRPPCSSLPSRERGLKLQYGENPVMMGTVAPFTGAWIEILHNFAR